MERTQSVSIETSLLLQQPSRDSSIKDCLLDSFDIDEFDGLRVMVATISKDGLSYYEDQLEQFCRNGNSVTFLIGTQMCPDPQGLRKLRDLEEEWPDLVSLQLVQMDSTNNLFHPKIYWFHGNSRHRMIVGSANWTKRGHSDNVEAATCSDVKAPPAEPPELIQEVYSTWTQVYEACQSEGGWGTLLDPTSEVIQEFESCWNSDTNLQEQDYQIQVQQDTSDGVWPLLYEHSELVMDLTMEQGGNRVSQVQPPLTVWRGFFDIEPSGEQPEYILEDVRTGDKYRFGVVGHDHNWTLEIPGARVSRPAIIVMRKESEYRLKYGVYTPQDDEFDEIDEFLDEQGETPHHQQERRQFISNP